MVANRTEATGPDEHRSRYWSESEAGFRAELAKHETADVLLGLGEALWWLGETERSVGLYRRAYAAYRRDGSADRAAWAALWLALTYGSDFGNAAAFHGWLARASRLLDGPDPSPMHGWLWLVRAYGTSDPPRSLQLAERTLDYARDADDSDLELCALAHLGKVMVSSARVESGLALVDEAMAGTFGGERSRLDTVVFTSCSMIDACDLAADLERASQWCAAVDDFMLEYGCPFLRARCRGGYGSVLVTTGRWAEAER
ncbi:MAG: hypothetical protein WD314_01055 [Trueperaceae bacterium]